MRNIITIAAAGALMALGAPALADHHGAKNVVETAKGSDQHTTLVAAVEAANLGSTLSSPGPFTVFAPTNAAFDKLPDGVVSDLLKPENQAQLQAVLTYHVVPGRYTAANLLSMIEQNGGMAELSTAEGSPLVARVTDGTVTITDENGNAARVVSADLSASNGVIHVTDTVSLPG